MKRSRLVSFLLLTSTVLSMSNLAVAAQTRDRAQRAEVVRPNRPTPVLPNVEVSDRVLVTAQTVTLRRGKPGEEPGYRQTAQVQYPRLSGLKDPAVLEKVQAAVSLKTIIGQSLAEIRAELLENYWLTDIGYKVNYNQNFLLDLTYTIEGVGAYPSQYEKHVTVDLKAGKKLRSHDVFKRELLGTIAMKVDKIMQAEMAEAIAKVEKDGEDIRPYANQAKFRIKQVDDFEINDQGVTFRYDFGFPHVIKAYEPAGRYFFTYAQLKSYIRPDGPLEQFVK
jgi:hypothetical protein